MDSELISQLIDMIKNLSPEVWRVLLQQVRVAQAEIAYNLVASLIVAYASTRSALWVFRTRVTKDSWGDYDFDELTIVLLLVLGLTSVGSILYFFTMLGSAFTAFGNPEFYAIKLMLDLVK